MITTINEFKQIFELVSKDRLTGEWFHGDMQKMDIHNRKFDLTNNMVHKNSHGPGIYFTRLKWQARGYAEPNGYVYTITVDLDPKRTLLDDTKIDVNKLRKFIELCPEKEFLSNYSENPRLAIPMAIKLNVESSENMLDAVMGVYNDLYQDNSDLFIKSMIEIGYDALFHKLPEVDHLIIYNTKIVNEIKEEKLKDAIDESSKQLNLNELKKDLEIFRKNMEDEDEWEESKDCFKGTCQDVTNRLEEYLINKGYDAKRVRGYYKNSNDEYYPNIIDWDLDDQEIFSKQYHRNGDSSNGLKFPHWWIEIDKYIIDLTEDQFHPGEEDEYRIGIYKKPNKYYKIG